jgi:calcium/calmodulin-dependent protein kinase I
LSGENATDHNLLPEIRAYLTRARLRRGIEMVKLANRIEALKMQEDDPENSDMPKDATLAADQTRHFSSGNANNSSSSGDEKAASSTPPPAEKRTLSKAIKGAIFREVVLAKVREMKEQEETLKVTGEAQEGSSKTA